MRRPAPWIFIGVALMSAAAFARQGGAAADAEPPLLLFAEHEGREVAVALDRPVTLGATTFTLRARPHRVLESRDFEVHYPRGYHFEHTNDEVQAAWTLTGGSSSLMLFAPKAPMDPETYLRIQVQVMTEQFEGTTAEDVRLAIEGHEVEGRRLRMMLGSSPVVQDVFVIAVGGGRVLTIVIQDSSSDGSSAEAAALRELVSRTLRLRA